MIPKIKIKYNRFLDPIFISWVQIRPSSKPVTIPSRTDVLRRTKNYNKVWDKYGKNIITGITKATGLLFVRNHIDVHVVSVNPRSFSSPIIIKSRCSDVDFINTITHELVHCLFVDNFEKINHHIPWSRDIKVADIANDHIFLHAILKYVYLDVLKSPQHLKANIATSKKAGNEGYANAWSIVTNGSYKSIIKEFKRRIK